MNVTLCRDPLLGQHPRGKPSGKPKATKPSDSTGKLGCGAQVGILTGLMLVGLVWKHFRACISI